MTVRIGIAVIPARGGSVRLPGKNVMPLGGIPLIGWTIRAALASGCFERVIVNTDCKDIAAVAQEQGAEIPFLRPPHLATAEASSVDMLLHTLETTGRVEAFALLQPTSPFRNSEHIKKAAAQFANGPASVLSVTRAKPLAWHYTLGDTNTLKSVEHPAPSDDLTVIPNGAMYFCKTDAFVEGRRLVFEDTQGFEMSSLNSVDIDTHDDFALAAALVGHGVQSLDV